MKIDLEDFAILSDFDGTIASEDTNIKLIEMYGNEKVMQLLESYKSGKISFKTYFELQFKEFRLNEEEYIDYILGEFNLTKGFLNFYKNIEKKRIPFAILSGGFKNAIIPFLSKYGIENINIIANSLEFNGDNMKVEWYGEEIPNYKVDYGPYGKEKVKHYKKYKKKNETVAFIGDGTSDQSVVQVADIVFAKDSLLEYCEENNIDYIPWEDFNDINNIIFQS